MACLRRAEGQNTTPGQESDWKMFDFQKLWKKIKLTIFEYT